MKLYWDKRGVNEESNCLALRTLHQENFIITNILGRFSVHSHLSNTKILMKLLDSDSLSRVIPLKKKNTSIFHLQCPLYIGYNDFHGDAPCRSKEVELRCLDFTKATHSFTLTSCCSAPWDAFTTLQLTKANSVSHSDATGSYYFSSHADPAKRAWYQWDRL